MPVRGGLAAMLLAIVTGVVSGPASAGPAGSLDPTFGVGGRAQILLPGDLGILNAVARQPDGALVVAGYGFSGAGVLARVTSDGALDPSFGTGGIVVDPTVTYAGLMAVRVRPDGKLIVAAQGEIRRYDATGSIDPSFGAGGTVPTAFGILTDRCIALLDDGRIVAAGAGGKDVVVARFNPDGTPDATFGVGGTTETPFDTEQIVLGLVVQADGRIVLTGRRFGGGPEFLLRYEANGAPDATFGSGGMVSPAQADAAVALQPDGRILTGSLEAPIARYNADGTLDDSFVGDPDSLRTIALVVEPDGKILGLHEFSPPILARYQPDGSLDTGFGTGGRVRRGFDFSHHTAMLREPDGRIVVGGGQIERHLGGTCGNGQPEGGEDCDDGNFVAGDGCEPSCCDADADGDGACDANDPCTGGVELSARVTVAGLLRTGSVSQKLSIRADLTLPHPFTPPLDPLANGIRLVLEDAVGVLIDQSIPGGAFADPPGVGWKGNAAVPPSKWTWASRVRLPWGRGSGPSGLTTIKVGGSSATPGRLRVSAKGKGGYGGISNTAPVPPLALRIVLDVPTAATGQCAELSFTAAGCTLAGGGGTLKCR